MHERERRKMWRSPFDPSRDRYLFRRSYSLSLYASAALAATSFSCTSDGACS